VAAYVKKLDEVVKPKLPNIFATHNTDEFLKYKSIYSQINADNLILGLLMWEFEFEFEFELYLILEYYYQHCVSEFEKVWEGFSSKAKIQSHNIVHIVRMLFM
jgi:hypothetical protein